MKDNIFSLVYSDYDTREHFFFSAPPNTTEKDFKELCDRLVPKAGYRAVIMRQSFKESDDWICWRDVVEELVSLLQEQGYQRISLENYHLHTFGTIIHEDTRYKEQLGFATDLVIEHNVKLEKKLAEERKNKRKLSGLLKKKMVQIIK